MSKTDKKQKKEGKIMSSLRKSPINYFSDLFIVAMVMLWIVDNVYESIIASIVTLSSIKLSLEAGYNCYEVSMWSSIGSNVAIPLSCGGAIWMIKNSVQHAIANRDGKKAHEDFPAVPAEGADDGWEKMMFQDEGESHEDVSKELDIEPTNESENNKEAKG